MISEQLQAKGVKEFKDKKEILVSYPSRSATMPLVFLNIESEEWYVLSKDNKLMKYDQNIYGSHNGSNTLDAVLKTSKLALMK